MKRQIFRNKLENPPVHVYNLTGISRGGGGGKHFCHLVFVSMQMSMLLVGMSQLVLSKIGYN